MAVVETATYKEPTMSYATTNPYTGELLKTFPDATDTGNDPGAIVLTRCGR